METVLSTIIPFHRPFMDDDEINEVIDSLKSGWWTIGPKTKRFEEEFAAYLGVPSAVSANSWTGAAHLVLDAFGLQPGDEVILPPLTFTASAEIVHYFQAKPVLADIDPVNLGISVREIEKKITSRTRAIIPVHYAGIPCDLDELYALAKAKNIRVLEDAAHALPSYYKGKLVGSIGDTTCFSFYVTKTLATGEGGMITSSDEAVLEKTKLSRLHGMSKDSWARYSEAGSWGYDVVTLGYKYNFTDIGASLGVAQLKKVNMLRDMRKAIAAVYDAAFAGLDFLSVTPRFEDRESSYHLYPILINPDSLSISRAQFIEELKARGILTAVHFIPLYRFSFYRDRLGNTPEEFPVTESFYQREISLPIFPGMTEDEIGRVITAVTDIGTKFRR